MKKLLSILLTAVLALSVTTFTSRAKIEKGDDLTVSVDQTNGTNGSLTEGKMSIARKEFEHMVKNPADFPVNFVYDGVYYSGFSPFKFKEVSKVRTEEDGKISVMLLLKKDDTLNVLVNTVYYEGYEAWDYTVHFQNPSASQNSGVIEKVNAIDIAVEGTNPVLKGILGDHGNQYAPYEYDLLKRDVNFTSTLGRATHNYFPYFNLENDNGGVLFAIGWGGTWQADFNYNENNGSTRFVGTGTVGLQTYLKPGESIRTPLIAAVRYYERDEDKAMNLWRDWVIDCNLPSDTAESEGPVKPATAVGLMSDTGRPNSDGSISEGYDSWKRSLDSFYDNGLTADYRWMDAGWYFSPYGETVPSDWWGTVGTWDLDTVKWPNGSFKESVDYGEAHGTKTFLWFEPERVTHLAGMVANYNYKREWVLSDHGDNNCYLNNLGNRDCLEWTLDRILTTMEENNIYLYREDFNFDPGIFWSIGDGYEGENRVGITENLYMQGHYELFDRIIAWGAKNGKATYVDSCASGGGRNDLETIRRSVPFLRSDSDRTTIELRLAMTTRLVRWLPYTGASTKESANQLTVGGMDIYVLRASMLPFFHYGAEWYHSKDSIDWATLRQGQAEWKELSKYFYADFYVLTPFRGTTDNTVWTAYEYFDAKSDSGAIQAFRGVKNDEEVYKVQVKGVNPNAYYNLRDIDGVNSYTKIKGSALMKGLPIYAENPRTAITIYIEPCEA